MKNKIKSGKVLIVDDCFEDREVYKRFIQKSTNLDFSISIIEAPMGREAKNILMYENPDCILLDYMLPDMTGVEFLAELKEMSYLGGVVMVTGEGDEKVAVDALKNGACDYLVKNNFSQNEFLQAIAKSIKISWSNKTKSEMGQAI